MSGYRTVAWVLLLFLSVAHALPSGLTYRSAVVELAPRGSSQDGPEENLMKTMGAMESYAIRAAEKNIDIMVFPEAVLWTWGLEPPHNWTGTGRDFLRRYGQQVPFVGSVPCRRKSTNIFDLLRNASCMALKYRTTMVINTIDIQPCNRTLDRGCPTDGRYQFNTNVVFDGLDGSILAVYHKFHLFHTFPTLDRPKTPEVTSFKTSFGVRFGMFICFDIQFDHPVQDLLNDGVRHFVYSTWWYNSPPIFTATMFQQAFSRTHNSVLLAANTGESYVSSGSGIYSSGAIKGVHFDPTGFREDAFLVADVPVDPGTPDERGDALRTLNDELASVPEQIPPAQKGIPCSYGSPSLVRKGSCVPISTRSAVNLRLRVDAIDGFSCSLQANISGAAIREESQSYVLWGSSGYYRYNATGSKPMLVQSCAIFHCDNMNNPGNDSIKCAPTYNATQDFSAVKLSGTFSSKVYAMVAVDGAALVKKDEVQVTETETMSTLFFENSGAAIGKLFSATLYSLGW